MCVGLCVCVPACVCASVFMCAVCVKEFISVFYVRVRICVHECSSTEVQVHVCVCASARVYIGCVHAYLNLSMHAHS